ncbi:hypothetical protein L596_000693 [Steinernema carpocapsae]|uniref:Chitin-binding type-2 domain-containing protein n=1 Tax=Steinernema carpocapsae TaxID=34508 RepID=A0A4U8UK60_STECR|nr:hypothetical protein L596_000693 [Steinernema carpocapsae]
MLFKLLVFSCFVAVIAASNHVGPTADRKPYFENFSKKLRDLNCATLGEGAFVLGCSHEFVVCEPYSQWHMTLFFCPIGHDSKHLIINPENNKCEETQRVPVCQSDANPNVPIKINRKRFDCEGKNDGLYAIKACSQDYASCQSNVSTIMVCPYAQYFDEAAGACDYEENCGKVTRGKRFINSHESFERFFS